MFYMHMIMTGWEIHYRQDHIFKNILPTADTSDIQPSDYAFAGTVLAKFPESSDSAGIYFQKAISTDTVKENQTNYLNSAVDVATRTNNYGTLLGLIQFYEKTNRRKSF